MSASKKLKNSICKLNCPRCQKQLWHLGSPKYYLSDSWLEEFFCEEHNNMWLRLSSDANDAIVAVIVKLDDWCQIVRTEC